MLRIEKYIVTELFLRIVAIVSTKYSSLSMSDHNNIIIANMHADILEK